MIRLAILLLALASSALAGTAIEGPRTFKALNLTGAAATAFKYLDGDSFDSCNFQQPVAHTAIGGTARGLVFTACNLMNCDSPRDATLKQCLNVHMRTVVVETRPVADIVELSAAEEKAIAAATATLDAQIAALQAKRAAAADAARQAVRASRLTAQQWVPTEGLAPVPVLDAKGVTTSYHFTRQEIIP